MEESASARSHLQQDPPGSFQIPVGDRSLADRSQESEGGSSEGNRQSALATSKQTPRRGEEPGEGPGRRGAASQGNRKTKRRFLCSQMLVIVPLPFYSLEEISFLSGRVCCENWAQLSGSTTDFLSQLWMGLALREHHGLPIPAVRLLRVTA